MGLEPNSSLPLLCWFTYCLQRNVTDSRFFSGDVCRNDGLKNSKKLRNNCFCLKANHFKRNIMKIHPYRPWSLSVYWQMNQPANQLIDFAKTSFPWQCRLLNINDNESVGNLRFWTASSYWSATNWSFCINVVMFLLHTFQFSCVLVTTGWHSAISCAVDGVDIRRRHVGTREKFRRLSSASGGFSQEETEGDWQSDLPYTFTFTSVHKKHVTWREAKLQFFPLLILLLPLICWICLNSWSCIIRAIMVHNFATLPSKLFWEG